MLLKIRLLSNAYVNFTVFFTLILSVAAQASGASPIGTEPRKNESVVIMAYNVENLFDLSHDAGKEDYTYLPLAEKQNNPEVQAYCNSLSNAYYKKDCLEIDWNSNVLAQKVLNVGQVISSANNGRGPDILVLEEVENIHALRELNERGLAKLGFKTVVLIEGPDTRGIDVGILSRYPLVESKSHRVEIPPSSDGKVKFTRDILEARLRVGNQIISVFANHWPSQSNPSEHRDLAAQTLYKAALAAHKRGDVVVAAGDFNTLDKDSPHGINSWIKNGSREISFYDATFEKKSQFPQLPLLPGTHWHQGSWSHLDRIFVLKQSVESKKVEALWDTFTVHAPDFALESIPECTNPKPGACKPQPFWGRPLRFNHKTLKGFADHLSVYMELKL